MAVRIRLSRFGRLHRPYFRIIAIDGRRHREGEANEILGSYDPLLKDKNIQVDMDRVQAWVSQGALISEGLTNLLKHHGYALPGKAAAAKPAKKAEKKPAAKKPAGKKGEKQPFVAASRRAVRQHAARQKAVRKAKLAEEAAAKAAAAPAGDAAAEPAKS